MNIKKIQVKLLTTSHILAAVNLHGSYDLHEIAEIRTNIQANWFTIQLTDGVVLHYPPHKVVEVVDK